MRVKVPKSDKPLVSIVIPVYGQLQITLECLKSIQNAKDSTEIEVILLDDNSPDPNVEKTLSKIEGLIYVRNKKNLRFVKNVNKGAKIAKGKYVFFLNNDTKVTDHYLETSLELFERFDKVFSVGSKLIYPNGKLQEAGSILHTDATGINYGAFDDPDHFEYNYVREVHYCSAAALLVKKDILKKLGWFDEDFSPGYYDDSELQMRAKKMGYKTLYQPKSVIIHYEGMSHGKDKDKFRNKISLLQNVIEKFKRNEKPVNIKPYQIENKKKMLQKRSEELKTFCFDANEDLRKKIFLKSKPQLFFFEDNLPEYDKASGSLRLLNLLKILQKEFSVTLITRNNCPSLKYYDEVTQSGIRVLLNKNLELVNIYKFLNQNIKFADILVFSRPEVYAFFYDFIQKQISDKKLNIPIIYDTVDIHFLRLQMQKQFAKNESEINFLNKMYKYHRALETLFIADSTETWVVSFNEEDFLIKNNYTKKVRVISNIVDITPTKTPYTKRKDMLFIGGFGHEPNVDAVEYYYNEIIPLLKKEKLNIKLNVVGSKSERLPDYIKNNKYIKIHGFIEDLNEIFEKSLIAFYPLRYGAGIKGKVTQAMAMGLPIVTTDIGAQGLKTPENLMLIANLPSEQIAAIKKYLTDHNLWQQHRNNSLNYIENNLSFNATHQQIKKFKNEYIKNI
jgi:GT2 family glycosyltransferase